MKVVAEQVSGTFSVALPVKSKTAKMGTSPVITIIATLRTSRSCENWASMPIDSRLPGPASFPMAGAKLTPQAWTFTSDSSTSC